jgi:hypothetical protein
MEKMKLVFNLRWVALGANWQSLHDLPLLGAVGATFSE